MRILHMASIGGKTSSLTKSKRYHLGIKSICGLRMLMGLVHQGTVLNDRIV
ncbi:hypothetical protein J6590_022390 [Homalodisca vitripennis]|nr:hypothetical protein J6590_022390 [Homalodisca vitripennis]